jgi:4,5-DOPA dioxygenase extradiol
MNAIEDTPWRAKWAELGRQLPRPRAIVCVSAHWLTRRTLVGSAESPETIHDFGGFPQELHAVRWPAPGAPAVAARVRELLDPVASLDAGRGLDHGVWSVLMPMYPEADVPVVPLSIAYGPPGSWHVDLARRLAPLRDEGVMVVASGNLVHHLGFFDSRRQVGERWAVSADRRIADRVAALDVQALADWPGLGAEVALAVNSADHYLPALYAVALARSGEPVQFFNEDVQSSISMRSFLIGQVP